MKILSHRGYWKQPDEKNSEVAFKRSFELGFGTETDIRDQGGKLVISHDMPLGGEMPLESFLELSSAKALPMAINIKSDGLAAQLAIEFKNCKHDWFVFDMSIPDMRVHLNVGNPVFARMSEVEPAPPWLDECKGVWIDSFSDTWFAEGDLRALLGRGLQICVVSPELHKRQHAPLWQLLFPLRSEPGLMLCTDIPEDAAIYLA